MNLKKIEFVEWLWRKSCVNWGFKKRAFVTVYSYWGVNYNVELRFAELVDMAKEYYRHQLVTKATNENLVSKRYEKKDPLFSLPRVIVLENEEKIRAFGSPTNSKTASSFSK